MEHTNATILEYFSEYEISEIELKKLHDVLLLILDDIHVLCEEYNLHYMLCGGTLLGAIRHRGFIPWDDDVDIMIQRNDYYRLKEAILEKYGDKYTVLLLNDGNSPYRMMKIMLNGTVYREILCENVPSCCGIFIDVFPIDYIPKHHLLREKVFNFATKAFFAIRDYKYPSKIILEKCRQYKKLKKYYNKRRRVGHLCNIFFGERFYRKRLLSLSEYKKITSLQGIPLGIYYSTEIFDSGTFDERELADFSGHSYYIPCQYDVYLKNLYGDYMKLPPEDKRRRHQVAEIDFGVYSSEVNE